MNDFDAWMESERAAEEEIKNESAEIAHLRKENAVLKKMNKDKIDENRKLKAALDRLREALVRLYEVTGDSRTSIPDELYAAVTNAAAVIHESGG